MPDRTATPEELLDQWLDALNEPGGAVPPAPAAIAELAAVALDYRRALGTNGAAFAAPERNGKMHHAQTLAAPNGMSWRIVAQPRRQGTWSSWLATAAMIALLVGLVGGAALRTWGLPGGDDPGRLAGVIASPAATPASGALSCASDGYLPVVSGGLDYGDLAMLGGPDRVIRETDDGVFVPLPNGETRELPPGSNIYPDSDLALAIHDDNSATVTRISTGETWEYPAVKPRVEGQPYWDFFTNGRYVIGPTDDSRTDWLITDTLTGETRTTADILGKPFAGPLYLWMQAPSENGDFWLLQFMTLVFPDYDETPPASGVDAPGYLVIPGSLDDAWLSESSTSVEPIEPVISPEGTSFIVNQVVRDSMTGERVDSGDDNLTFFGTLIGYLDEATLLTYRQDTVDTVDIDTGGATPIYTAPDTVQSVAWDRDAGTLAVSSGTGDELTWVLFDLDTGEATPLPELDGYRLANLRMHGSVGRFNGAAAFIDPEDDRDISVRALDMRTGTVSSAVTTRTDGRDDGAPRDPARAARRFVQTTDVAGTTLFIDAASGTAVTLPTPDGVMVPDGGQLYISVVPDGTCATLTARDASGKPAGNTWIAPIEPGAHWTELPFSIAGWRELQVDDIQTLPAQDFTTPAATPASGALSCASPGYRAVVRGPVDDASRSLLGSDPIDTTSDTVTAANGAEITFGPGERWVPWLSGNVILSGDADGDELPTVTSLATGQSWTFPELDQPGGSLSGSYVLIGPWLIGPTDETATDWRIVNTITGEERLTSELFGAPFDGPARPSAQGPWNAATNGPMLLGFSRIDHRDQIAILPSRDLDDAHALAERHAEAGWTGAITPDGSRIAYLHLNDNGAATVRVLDGFTGEQIAEYPAPETADFLQPFGLAADGSKLIVRDNRHVWTVDLTAGAIATVFDPGGLIHTFELDSSTGTALASAGDDALFWIDPAAGEVKALDVPSPLRVPQPQLGWALFQGADSNGVGYVLLDMATGELVGPISADRDGSGTNVWITGGDKTGVWMVLGEPGTMLVLDGPGGQAFELSTPESDGAGWNGVAIGVSPNAECLIYSRVGEGGEPGTSWVAPLAPDAAWAELPFELAGWMEAPQVESDTTETPVPTVTPFPTAPTVIEPINPDHTPASTPTATTQESSAERPAPTLTPLAIEAQIVKPLPPTSTPAPTTAPELTDLLPGGAIPIVETSDPGAVDQSTFGTIHERGPAPAPGITLPLPNGEVLALPDAFFVQQLPGTSIALVDSFDTSRSTIDLTTGETLVDGLPPAAEGERWVGAYLLTPARDGTTWRIVDVRTGGRADTATLGGGPFDREVTAVPMPSPLDAPGNAVVQFAFETAPGDLQPWQGLATDVGPPSGTLVIPGSLADARFLDGPMGSTDPRHPVVAISRGTAPLVAYTTPGGPSAVVLEDAVTGEQIATWSDSDLTQRMHPVYLTGFSDGGDSLVAWLGSGGYGPAFVHQLSWPDGDASITSHELDLTAGPIDIVVQAGGVAFVAVLGEPDGAVGLPTRWKKLDLDSGELTDLPALDGMLVYRFVPGDPWLVFNSIDLPPSSRIAIVDAATGEVAARLDDPDLGSATARSSSCDGGVIVITGHPGDERITGYVIDARSGASWAIDPPAAGQLWYGVSPDGSVLTASTSVGDGWIASVDPVAEWTPLPAGHIVDWLLPPVGG